MRMFRIACLALAAFAAVPAGAQDAERIDLARQVLVATRAADNVDAMLPSIFTALKPAIVGSNPKAAKDWDEIIPLMIKEFSVSRDEMIQEIALIYAKSFETDELRQFIAFFKTPAGDKLARSTPAIAQQSMVVGQRIGQQMAVKVSERMKDELRKRGNPI